MVTSMKATFPTGKRMAKACTLGLISKFTTGSGLMESRKVMECGEVSMAIPTLENGKTVRLMGTECTNGKTGTDTRVNGSNVSNTVKALISSLMATITQATMSTGSPMVTASTYGPMAVPTRECSTKV